MSYPLAFFDLNYRFARRITEITGMPLGEAALRYTHLYLAFGLGRSFTPSAPAWQVFLVGLSAAPDPAVWIDANYHRLTDGLPPRKPENAFGCFSYAVWENGRIRLHFWAGDSGESPLKRECMDRRTGEIRALLEHVRVTVPTARTIVGGSWLYNIAAYRRLFPPDYLETARPEDPEPQFIALWGQFLDHQGQVKEPIAERFLAAIAQQTTLDGLLHAFPYPVLRLECAVDLFYPYYGISAPYGAEIP